MKLAQSKIDRIKKLCQLGMNFSKIGKELKISRFKARYYCNRSEKRGIVGRPKGKKNSFHSECNDIINSLPVNSYYRSVLIKKLEEGKKIL